MKAKLTISPNTKAERVVSSRDDLQLISRACREAMRALEAALLDARHDALNADFVVRVECRDAGNGVTMKFGFDAVYDDVRDDIAFADMIIEQRVE